MYREREVIIKYGNDKRGWGTEGTGRKGNE